MSSEPEGARKPAPGPSLANAPKVRRRNRIITSCLECRRRKLKCDRLHPCNHCAKATRDCVFLSPALDSTSKGKLNQFKESIDNLEKGLERHAEGSSLLEWTVSPQSNAPSPDRHGGAMSFDHLQHREPIPADEQDLEPSPLTVTDVTYDDDGDDLMEDLGVRVGKIRITERLGGFVRPRLAEEVADRLFKESGGTAPGPSPGPAPAKLSMGSMGSPQQSSESSHSYLEPSPEYMAPGENLMFQSSTSDDISLINFLPSRDFADRLITQYWAAVHLIARIVHRPAFERQYNQFWQEVAQGFEPSNPLQALVFATMFSAAISLSAETTEAEFGCSRDDMLKTFRAGCEHALSRSKLLRTTKVMTLQACVMYLLAISRSEVSRAHASFVSMVIRLAECAGLHRDGTTFGLSLLDTHVRRLIWYQLCFLDIRTVEAVGPRPTIRKEDYDTKLPLHVNDTELESLVPPKQDAARFTDMTVGRIRFESFEIFRAIWFERPLIEKGQSSLTALLRKVEEFREYTLQKFMPLIDRSIPVQNYAAKLLQLLLYKMHVGILHRYAISVPKAMPERLLEVVWSSGTGFLEVAIEIDTSPIFKPWAWYLGAYNQYHTALLLIYMVYATPDHPEADRIWKALDYVFELPENLSRPEKVILAMSVTSHRLDEYQKQRKRRVPASVDQSLGLQKSFFPNKKEESSSASSFQPLPSPPSDSSYAVQSMSDHSSSTDPWLFPPTSENESMNFSTAVSAQTQIQPVGMAQQLPLQSSIQFSSSTNMAQSTSPQNPMGAGTDAGATPFADLDWDELNRLFPQDAPMLSFDPVPPTQPPPSNSAGVPAMTYFPTPWIRHPSNQQNFGNP